MNEAARNSLTTAAANVRTRAHAPYSNFQVGAAVLTASGEIFAGCNVENASYGLTICAERVAVGSAVAAGHKEIVAVAVVSSGGHSPCGACRQVLSEFGPAMEVILIDADDPTKTRTTTLAALLPEQFSSAAL
jgi:cytidine deaminase